MNNQKYMDQLAVPIKLSFPVINVSTFELGRAETVFELVAKNVGKAFVKMPFNKLPDPNTLKAFVAEATKDNKNGVVVFDTFFHERMKANHETMPALKSSLFYLENEGINYIIAGNYGHTPHSAPALRDSPHSPRPGNQQHQFRFLLRISTVLARCHPPPSAGYWHCQIPQ